MSHHLLPLKNSRGEETLVPARLPDTISFDCFVPGAGILAARLRPTSSDPQGAAVGGLEAWRKDDSTCVAVSLSLTQVRNVLEQAEEVLSYVVARLLLRAGDSEQFKAMQAIADMADAEVHAWEAYERLPESVRRAVREHPLNPHNTLPEHQPSACAMAAYVESLVEQAQEAATESATARQYAHARKATTR